MRGDAASELLLYLSQLKNPAFSGKYFVWIRSSLMKPITEWEYVKLFWAYFQKYFTVDYKFWAGFIPSVGQVLR